MCAVPGSVVCAICRQPSSPARIGHASENMSAGITTRSQKENLRFLEVIVGHAGRKLFSDLAFIWDSSRIRTRLLSRRLVLRSLPLGCQPGTEVVNQIRRLAFDHWGARPL